MLDVGVQRIEDDLWSVRTSPHGSAHMSCDSQINW